MSSYAKFVVFLTPLVAEKGVFCSGKHGTDINFCNTLIKESNVIVHGDFCNILTVHYYKNTTPGVFKRALDIGAYGVLVPWVNSKEEAELAVKATRYAPEGLRPQEGGHVRPRLPEDGG